MSREINNSGYSFLKDIWGKHKPYDLNSYTNKKIQENFGSFSIRAAIRPPYSHRWANPWERQETVSWCGVS